MDKLTSMRVFTRVAKTGSFSGAAEELGISRAMASKHIISLETLLGVRLFNRSTRRLSITEAGSTYLEHSRQILEDIEDAEHAITQLHSEPRGTLRIQALPYFGTYHLVPAIADYHKLYPNIRVELILTAGSIDLIEDRLDLAIQLGDLEDSNIVARPLAPSHYVICGSPDYLHEHGTPKYPEELHQHNCLCNWSMPPKRDWPFNINGHLSTIRVSGSMRANVAGALRLAATEGLGLVLLPTYMAGKDLQSGRLQAVLTEFEAASLAIHAVYPHRKHLSAKVRTFVDFLSERFQPQPYWDNWMVESKSLDI